MDTYELEKDKTKYSSMKEYVAKMKRILSNTTLEDKLTKAQRCLNNYYLVDGNPVEYTKLSNVKSALSSAYNKICIVKTAIDGKLDDIDDDIKKAEQS